MTPRLRKLLFETLYKNRYLYRFASTIPFAGQWRVWQRLVLPRLHGQDILELGCGLGDLLADMLEAGYRCQAVEHSPEMVSAARATLRRRESGQPSLIIQGTAQHLPFSPSTFDTVVSTFPSEYIYDPDSIAEIARVLRPGGRLIVIEGANLLPVGFVQPALVLLQSLVYGPHQQHDPHEEERTSQSVEVITEVIPDARFGLHIPLERFNLQRRSERVRSRRWEVYITIGTQKIEAPPLCPVV
ncbi:MAG: class I SAM-dependent methyltransferase [Ktedonobacteraceae bacterium]|nr:class I SAM-dependent methyltransferase [Ktedonobacteraceae bacterium]MBO0795982.1 class I SAM-dependent methyltransferase [Ktedonobacteraceae bacterium]